MFRSLKDLKRFTVGASDGTIGKVTDFYFDDQAWVIRYLVVETGTWLSSRKVLITPISVRHPGASEASVTSEAVLPVALTRDQVRHAPTIDTDKPVSRQHEVAYYGYYGYPYYWGGTGLWGEGMLPMGLLPGAEGYGSEAAARAEADAAYEKAERRIHSHDDPHLRSCAAVIGYHVHTTDGEIGHISDLLVDERTWSVRYVVVDTSNWWLGHRVLVAPQWITAVNWSSQSIQVDLAREAIRLAPTFESTEALNRGQESELYQHYGRAGYWPPIQP